MIIGRRRSTMGVKGTQQPPEVVDPEPPPYRDHLLQPYDSTSIWNTPIGDAAAEAPAGLADALYNANDYVTVDPIHLAFDASASIKTVASGGYVNGNDIGLPPASNQIPAGSHARIPDSMTHDSSWNGIAGILHDTDSTLAWSGQPLYRPNSSTDPTMRYTPEMGLGIRGLDNLYGDGRKGAHGGSALGGIGGTIRAWEWQGTDPIKHRLAVNLYGRRFLCRDDGGYVWPAYKADTGYSDMSVDTGGNFYGVTAVRVATTANVNLAGGGIAAGQVVDGVTLATGDRVLVKNQSTASQNGIYTAPASGGASRASDADADNEIAAGGASGNKHAGYGMIVVVGEGTANGDKGFRLSTVGTGGGSITLDTTSLTFIEEAGRSYSNRLVKEGTLLALPFGYDDSWITNSKVQRIATTLWSFGAHVVDNSARDVHAFSVEASVESSWNGSGVTFHAELMSLMNDLVVITDCSDSTPGGAGSARTTAPLPLTPL
jgi:hypothetical protein